MTLFNLARAYTATTGTGSVVVGAAVSGYLDWSHVTDGATVSYGIHEGNNTEVGLGTWTAATNTLARTTVYKSTNGDNPIVLQGQAQVYITILAEDITTESASSILTKLLTVDGTTSGLDADKLDGQHASAFLTAESDPVFAASEAAGFAAGAVSKLAGIEAGAEVNNISDLNATDLTDGDDTTLHTHLIAGITDVTTAMGTLVKETNVKGTFINDALIDGANPDMGYETDSNKSGYYTDWITDKVLSNVLIGGSARTDNGGLRVNVSSTPDTLEVYLRGVWNTIIYDFTTANGDLRHTPLSEQIYVWRGDSVTVGLNGRPIVQEYQVSMGCYPPARVLNGGVF